ncbi:nucleotidyltransferase [Konateibacter massiliensis]|uniref:nucleotidyltransferase n=1 Tax=Konateibacter massiliensis TaxID=2002841 RepID=UPI000C15162F|nr:nucleotidyltransferase [Konateibacter massiliensis]
MKIVGLITEYNPFHNGHLHHIKLAKNLTSADYVIVVMSGNFLQRGAPAIIDKYKRTEMALQCGADLVLELPCAFATGSAEFFAMGAVSLFHKLGCVDSVCFGSECGNIAALEEIADILTTEPERFQELLKGYLKEGASFPAARQKALLDFISRTGSDYDTFEKILSEPNNILAIEYIKAIKKLDSSIKPVTIKRVVSGYHDTRINDVICSASAIRAALQESGLTNFKEQVPSAVYDILTKEYKKTFPIYMNDFSSVLKYRLILSHQKPLAKYWDVSEALANSIANKLPDYRNAEDFMELLKNKQYTLTRINRSLTHILLHIEGDMVTRYIEEGYALYARILGFKRNSAPLLTELGNNAQIPLISKLADYKKLLSPLGIHMLEQDIFAADLYNTIVTDKFDCRIPNEFKQQIIIV